MFIKIMLVIFFTWCQLFDFGLAHSGSSSSDAATSTPLFSADSSQDIRESEEEESEGSRLSKQTQGFPEAGRKGVVVYRTVHVFAFSLGAFICMLPSHPSTLCKAV